MMKGDWLLVLALRDRAAKESLPVVEEEEYGDLAIWLQQKFDGYFAILVKKNIWMLAASSIPIILECQLKNEKQKLLIASTLIEKKQWEVYNQ